MRTTFTDDARHTFREVLARISAADRFAAVRFRDKVRRALKRIAEYPQLGNTVPEVRDLSVREFIVDPYRFFYVVDEVARKVWIVAIWHGRQIAAAP